MTKSKYFLEDYRDLKIDKWRWFVVLLIIIPLKFYIGEIRRELNYYISDFYDFLENYTSLVNVIKYYLVDFALLILFGALIYFLHGKRIKAFITSRNKFRTLDFVLSCLLFSIFCFLLISVEIIVYENNVAFNFKLVPFLKLTLISFVFVLIHSVFVHLLFTGYLMKFFNLFFKKKYQIIITGASIYASFRIYPYLGQDLLIHLFIFYFGVALFWYISVLLVDGIYVALGTYFITKLIISLVIQQPWHDLTSPSTVFIVKNTDFHLNVFINCYLPMIIYFIYTVLLIRVLRIDDWKERLGFK